MVKYMNHLKCIRFDQKNYHTLTTSVLVGHSILPNLQHVEGLEVGPVFYPTKRVVSIEFLKQMLISTRERVIGSKAMERPNEFERTCKIST